MSEALDPMTLGGLAQNIKTLRLAMGFASEEDRDNQESVLVESLLPALRGVAGKQVDTLVFDFHQVLTVADELPWVSLCAGTCVHTAESD